MEEPKQQISVPFCWEDAPGRPKTGWEVNDFFKWEQKVSVDPIPRRSYNPFLDDEEEEEDILELNAKSSVSAESSELTDLWSEWEGGGDESVMEFLFQMSSPEVKFFHEVCYKEGKDVAIAAASKRPPTLEELILLSRRLSCARRNNAPVSPIPSKTKVNMCGLFRTRVNSGFFRI